MEIATEDTDTGLGGGSDLKMNEPLLGERQAAAEQEQPTAEGQDCLLAPPQRMSRSVSQESLVTPGSCSRQRSWSNRSFGPMEAGSQRGSVLALASTAFGCGLLALPWVFASLGCILGTISLLVSALATYLSLRLLANAAIATDRHDYASVVQAAVGPGAALLLDASVGVYAFGCVLGNLVFFEDFGHILAAQLGLPSWFHRPEHVLLVVTVFPLMPLCLTRTLSSLRYIMLASVFSLVLVCCIIIAGSPQRFSELSAAAGFTDSPIGSTTVVLGAYWWLWPQIDSWELVPRTASMLFFAFCCHISFYATYGELESPTPQRLGKVLTRAVMLQTAIFFLVGVAGALSFGPPCTQGTPANSLCTPANVLAAARFAGPSSVVARVAMGLAILVVVPLNIHGARSIVSRRLLGLDAQGAAIESSRFFHITVTLCLLVGTSCTAAAFMDISSILGVVGGGCATTFMFAIPAVVTAVLRFGLGFGKAYQDAFAAQEAQGLTIGSWFGVTKSGVVVAAAFFLPCVLTGYLDASIAFSQTFST